MHQDLHQTGCKNSIDTWSERSAIDVLSLCGAWELSQLLESWFLRTLTGAEVFASPQVKGLLYKSDAGKRLRCACLMIPHVEDPGESFAVRTTISKVEFFCLLFLLRSRLITRVTSIIIVHEIIVPSLLTLTLWCNARVNRRTGNGKVKITICHVACIRYRRRKEEGGERRRNRGQLEGLVDTSRVSQERAVNLFMPGRLGLTSTEGTAAALFSFCDRKTRHCASLQ